jgi:hypothetical protein
MTRVAITRVMNNSCRAKPPDGSRVAVTHFIRDTNEQRTNFACTEVPLVS